MSEQQQPPRRLVTVDEGDDFLKIWHLGQLQYNYHDSGFQLAQQAAHGDVLAALLWEDRQLFVDFLKQLRQDGKLPDGNPFIPINPAWAHWVAGLAGRFSPQEIEGYHRLMRGGMETPAPAISPDVQKGLDVVKRLVDELDILQTDQAYLAIRRRDLFLLHYALSSTQPLPDEQKEQTE